MILATISAAEWAGITRLSAQPFVARASVCVPLLLATYTLTLLVDGKVVPDDEQQQQPVHWVRGAPLVVVVVTSTGTASVELFDWSHWHPSGPACTTIEQRLAAALRLQHGKGHLAAARRQGPGLRSSAPGRLQQ